MSVTTRCRGNYVRTTTQLVSNQAKSDPGARAPMQQSANRRHGIASILARCPVFILLCCHILGTRWLTFFILIFVVYPLQRGLCALIKGDSIAFPGPSTVADGESCNPKGGITWSNQLDLAVR